MAPRAAESDGEDEGTSQTPPPPPQPQPQPQPQPSIVQQPGPVPFAGFQIFRCPMFFCPSVRCPWAGSNAAMYSHFVTESAHHGNTVELREVNAATLCQWYNYATTCDIGGDENGFYRLLIRAHGKTFFLSAKANNDGMTAIQVIYIGQADKANKYSCKITIENRGGEAAAPTILTFPCGPTLGLSDIITIDQQIAVAVQNEVLKGCCAENGTLYFLVELQIPADEQQAAAENPAMMDVSDVLGYIDEDDD